MPRFLAVVAAANAEASGLTGSLGSPSEMRTIVLMLLVPLLTNSFLQTFTASVKLVPTALALDMALSTAVFCPA